MKKGKGQLPKVHQKSQKIKSMPSPSFHEIGKETGKIDVRVSYRIIQLFSDGLYSSPNKAVEELVANSWDAGASHVNIILPPDRNVAGAQIVVIDDGAGMDEIGLRQHWLLGDSQKRKQELSTPKGRKPIGRFGIGKLATYVLAHRLSHVTKINGKFFSTSMDYRRIDAGAGDATTEKLVQLPLRELTESQALNATKIWFSKDDVASKVLKLFGPEAAKSWTVAVMSDLKPMAKELSPGRLTWILETAMPLGDDFKLYLNGKRIISTKESAAKVGTWVLGRDIGNPQQAMPKPADDEFETSEDSKAPKGSPHKFGLFHPKLGRVTGYIEVYQDELGGKSEQWAQSSGFFVYVRGRRINLDDPGFGIDRNKLQHGTFARFRMVVYIDGLDDELRSSRESVRMGEPRNLAMGLLHSGFNHARNQLKKHLEESKPGAAMASRVADSPASLTTRPIVNLLTAALDKKSSPRYLEVPKNLTLKERNKLKESYENWEQPDFRLVDDSELVALSSQAGIAAFNVETRQLKINLLHPFVAHFLNEFNDDQRSLPLELMAISEVLLEANLYQTMGDEGEIHQILDRRDQLLRHLSKATGRKTAFGIAHDLVEAATDKAALEVAIVDAFESLGFESIPLGKAGRPDGVAHAHLASSPDGVLRKYAVSLEAKSKEEGGAKVSAKTVGISGIARQRDDWKCDHAVVVGPEFPASTGDSALDKEIAANQTATGRTITLIKVADLARLVRIQPKKRLGLEEIRGMFQNCRMPEECATWISEKEKEKRVEPPFKTILEEIYQLQQDEDDATVHYTNLRTALRKSSKKIEISIADLKTACQAMMRTAGAGYIQASEQTVELGCSPSVVLRALRSIEEGNHIKGHV